MLHLCNLLKTDHSFDFPTHEVRSCEDLDFKSETPIPLEHDFLYDTQLDNLEESSDPSSPLVVTPSLEFNIVNDNLEGSLIIHDLPLPLAPLGEPEEGDRFEIDTSFDDQCDIFFESDDTYFEEHSLEEPHVVEFVEVTRPTKLVNPIHVDYSLD